MVFVIGDIVKIGPVGSYRTFHTGTVTKLFSDQTIGVDDNRVDPFLFQVVIIGYKEPTTSKSQT